MSTRANHSAACVLLYHKINRPKKSFEFHQNDNCILWGTISDGQMQSYTFLVQPVWVQEPTIRQPVWLCTLWSIGQEKSFEFHQNDNCIFWGIISDGQMQSYTFLVQPVWVQEPTVRQPVRFCTMRFMGQKKFWISPKWQLHLVRDHKRWPHAKLHLPSTTGVSMRANCSATFCALVYHEIHGSKKKVSNFTKMTIASCEGPYAMAKCKVTPS